MRKQWWAAAAAGVIAAAAAAALTASGRGRQMDDLGFALWNEDRGPGVDAFMTGITEMGSIWASAAAAATLAATGRRRAAADAFGAAAAMWLVGQVAKKAVRRPRPYEARDDVRLLAHPPRGASWPSSHPAVLLSFLTVATRDLEAAPGLRAGAASLASVVGASRVYVGVHYPADVVGGMLLGRAVANLWGALVSPWIARPARPAPDASAADRVTA